MFEPLGLETCLQNVLAADLRALPATVLTALENLNVSEIGTQQLTDVILSDPVLAWRVLIDFGRSLSERSTLTVSGVQHCISLMGLERVARIVRATGALQEQDDTPAGRAYRRVLVGGLFAAKLADDWQRMIPQINYDHMILGTLLQRIPEASLWQAMPRAMMLIDRLVNERGLSQIEAESAVLGCEIHDIALRMGKAARLSDALEAAMDARFLPKPQMLMRWSRRSLRRGPGAIEYRDESIRKPEISTVLRVMLATHVASEAMRGWYGRRMRRYIRLVAGYIGQTEHEAWVAMRNTALRLAHQVPDPETARLAASLMEPPPDPVPRTRFTPETLKETLVVFNEELDGKRPLSTPPRHSAPARPQTPSPGLATQATAKPGFPSLSQQQVFEQHIARLTGKGPRFTLVQEVIRSGVDILKGCTWIDRIYLGLVQTSKDNIVSYYTAGCDDSPGLKRLEIKLSPPNLYSRLVKQPSCVWLTPDRQQANIGLIPGYVRQATQADEFMAASLFTARGPIAILYADKGTHRTALRESDFIVFRLLANATNQALALLQH